MVCAMDLSEKDYIVVVQCHLVMQRCSGYLCEKAFNDRSGGFADYPADKDYRTIYITCGGCCGLATQRKLTQLARSLKKYEGIDKSRMVVQLASCITKDNFHGPPCPHLDFIKTLIERAGMDYRCDTEINKSSQAKREKGIYSQ